MTIKDLTDLYDEKFYAIELISDETLETLEPFKSDLDSNKLQLLAFSTDFDDKENVKVLKIVVNYKQYIELKNWLKSKNLGKIK